MLTIEDVSFKYDSEAVLKNVFFEIKQGEKIVITGPSGSGKSTFLKLIAGFINPLKGDIIKDGISLIKPYTPPEQRNITLMSQDDLLFPHLTVKKNLLFSRRSIDPDLLNEYVSMLGLESLLNRMPSELSGGEKQRVSLGRSMIYQPDLILMDEPFKALDLELKQTLVNDVKTLFKKHNQTCIIVTHDPKLFENWTDQTFDIKALKKV
jgi:ABC-type Fe3+/spermidine/putrescine transport system ATPase subunit